MTTSDTSNISNATDQILCDLHDLGFHGKDLAHLEQLAAYIQQECDRARIDELERLYLVYGSKDKPASLDNIFSLGKKGEVCATPIKDRLAQLKDLNQGGEDE